ncbi:MAG: metal-dependent hydrolase [Planctomycetales bacterium]|nr:metal-dependent hydrolase [Planctomycetales bacterium]
MTIEVRWYGHGTWGITAGEHRIVLDPFFNDNPKSPIKAEQVEADYILVSHGHFDHVADAAAIANRTGATVLAAYEITSWLSEKHHVKNAIGMNLGGGVNLPFGRVKLTLAFHSSTLPDGTPGGNPGGFLLTIGGKKLYFACDTALFGDMRMIGDEQLDLAVLPIGDLFTMGPDDSIAALKLLRPKQVAPAHYNTWPPIEQDAAAWAERVSAETDASPLVLEPGEAVTL